MLSTLKQRKAKEEVAAGVDADDAKPVLAAVASEVEESAVRRKAEPSNLETTSSSALVSPLSFNIHTIKGFGY